MNDKWGIIGRNGKELLPIELDSSPDEFRDGFSRVQKNGWFGFINEKGEYLVEPVFDEAEEFVGGIALVKQNEKWGYIKIDGTYLLEPQFDVAGNFIDEFAKIGLKGRFGKLDTKGNIAWDEEE